MTCKFNPFESPLHLITMAIVLACSAVALGQEQPTKPSELERKAPQDSAKSNPLDDAIAQMREAQKRIEGEDIGKETRELQKQVADKLARLIQAAEQNSKRSSRRRPSPSQSEQPQEAEQKPDQPQAGEPRSSPGQRDRSDNAAQSQERELQGKSKNVEAREQGAAAQVWGHLPERLRQRLRNVDAGKTLPQYSDLVRRYFESLAEQGQKEKAE